MTLDSREMVRKPSFSIEDILDPNFGSNSNRKSNKDSINRQDLHSSQQSLLSKGSVETAILRGNALKQC